MRFVGAAELEFRATTPHRHRTNYYLGPDRKDWTLNAPSFERLRSKGLLRR